MKKMSSLSREKNINDAMIFSKMLSRLNSLTIPTIAKVNGATYGGGVGLVAACDVAIGAKNAKFCLSEVRIGLIPSVISPYVISAIGSSTLTVASATGSGISAADVLVINSSYGISLASTMTAAIVTGETLKFKRAQAGIDAMVYGIGQTVGAGQSMAPIGGYTNSDGNFVPGGIPYTTQGGGWVGVTTYMDCQGNLRVKSEVLVATSSNAGVTTNAGDGYATLDYDGLTVGAGINTGSNGILYPTNLGGTV